MSFKARGAAFPHRTDFVYLSTLLSARSRAFLHFSFMFNPARLISYLGLCKRLAGRVGESLR